MDTYFQYDEIAIEYLKKRDKRLAEVIEKIGKVKRPVITDLFTALIHSIVGQQISTKAHQTVWARMQNELGEITPLIMHDLPLDDLQRFGITFKKATYIKSVAQKIIANELDINALHTMSDEEVCAKLSELDGVGAWTAEMLMLHSMQRPNILSYGDLAILRGLRMVHHHRTIDKARFERYRKRYAPYGSVASIYLWAVSGGAIEEMKDYGIQKTKTKSGK